MLYPRPKYSFSPVRQIFMTSETIYYTYIITRGAAAWATLAVAVGSDTSETGKPILSSHKKPP